MLPRKMGLAVSLLGSKRDWHVASKNATFLAVREPERIRDAVPAATSRTRRRNGGN